MNMMFQAGLCAMDAHQFTSPLRGEVAPKGRVRGAMLPLARRPRIAPLTLTLSPEGRGDDRASPLTPYVNSSNRETSHG